MYLAKFLLIMVAFKEFVTIFAALSYGFYLVNSLQNTSRGVVFYISVDNYY